MDSNPPYASLALELSEVKWERMGLDPISAPVDDLDVMVDRITSILLVRFASVVDSRSRTPMFFGSSGSSNGICKAALREGCWPNVITMTVIEQLRKYVAAILAGYNDIPYHCTQHACHVALSTSKLIDMLWPPPLDGSAQAALPKSFGLRQDRVALAALVFSALIHDVEHIGVPNRQLSAEEDELAILYNDQSIAEQRSLYVGFKEFLKDDYTVLREAVFPEKEDYIRFRRLVVTLVLNTDIASPTMTQLNKSKWKEAFGQTLLQKAPSFRRLPSNPSDGSSSDEEEGSMLSHVKSSFNNILRRGSFGKDKGGSTKAPRSQSAPPAPATQKSFRKKLGIRRSMDLSGEALETFRDFRMRGFHEHVKDDEPDELKATVVMENIMTAADVAHNLQGWDQMVLWSGKLYLELRKAHLAGRGSDPQDAWYGNQIGFLESYLMPLARRLDQTGVFGRQMKPFAAFVKQNRDQWLQIGFATTTEIIELGEREFPAD